MIDCDKVLWPLNGHNGAQDESMQRLSKLHLPYAQEGAMSPGGPLGCTPARLMTPRKTKTHLRLARSESNPVLLYPNPYSQWAIDEHLVSITLLIQGENLDILMILHSMQYICQCSCWISKRRGKRPKT